MLRPSIALAALAFTACSQVDGAAENPGNDAIAADADGPETVANSMDASSGDAAAADSVSAETGSDATAPTFGDPFFGLSPDEGSWSETQAATLRGLGVGTVRFQFCDWPASTAALDTKVDIARKAGLHVYAELNYCTLAAPADPVERQRHWHEGFSDAGNDFAWKFASAAAEIAAHFAGRVDRYEIWNEPDAAPRPKTGWPSTHWPSAANADWDGACGTYDYGVDYGQGAWALCPRQLGVITTNAFMKIREKDAAAKIVAGNVLFHGDDAWVAKEYWKQVEASGAVSWHVTNKGRKPWDEIGIHPYAYDPVSGKLQAQVAAFRAIVAGASDSANVIISEYGWSTTKDDPNLYASEADQAQFLEQTFTAMKSSGMPLVMWFNYLSAPGIDFGIRRADTSWKPAASRYCKVAGGKSCP